MAGTKRHGSTPILPKPLLRVTELEAARSRRASAGRGRGPRRLAKPPGSFSGRCVDHLREILASRCRIEATLENRGMKTSKATEPAKQRTRPPARRDDLAVAETPRRSSRRDRTHRARLASAPVPMVEAVAALDLGLDALDRRCRTDAIPLSALVHAGPAKQLVIHDHPKAIRSRRRRSRGGAASRAGHRALERVLYGTKSRSPALTARPRSRAPTGKSLPARIRRGKRWSAGPRPTACESFVATTPTRLRCSSARRMTFGSRPFFKPTVGLVPALPLAADHLGWGRQHASTPRDGGPRSGAAPAAADPDRGGAVSPLRPRTPSLRPCGARHAGASPCRGRPCPPDPDLAP